VQATTVVLALGGIENARLLLSSDAEVRGGIGNGNDLVGRCFLDHVRLPSAALVSAIDDAAAPLYDSYHPVEGGAPRAVRVVLTLPAELQRRERLLNFGLTVQPRDAFPDLEDHAGGVRSLLEGLQGSPARTAYQIDLWPEPAPDLQSRVRLGTGRDALGMRRVVLDYRLAPGTLDSARRSLQLVSSELSRAGVGRVWSLAGGDDLDGWLGSDVRFSDHHMATTRMDVDPSRGVVDRDCRVHDTENLYVAGSSVFPTAGYAHATLTIIAMTLRLADHLRQAG
jgi:choline dehydrogenase-like flavoprotein